MARASLTSGAAFRGALYGIGVFIGVLLLSSAAVLVTARQTVIADIQLGLEAQLAMFQEMAAAGDQDAFTEAATDLARRFATASMAVAIYDPDGQVVTANAALPAMPARWRLVDGLATIRGDRLDRTLVLTGRAGTFTVVLGRDLAGVARVTRAIGGVLAAVGVVMVATLIGIGMVLSARSGAALDRIELALDRVSRGEFGARAPQTARPDQIDRVAAKINSHLDRLERLMDEARNRSAAIAHDLRTPLARAVLTAERLAERLEGGSPAAVEAEGLLDELERLAAIFESILRIARIEGSREEMPMEPVALGVLLSELLELYGPVAEANVQCLKVAGEATVTGERSMLFQMTANLVANATAHAGSGATIALTTGIQDGAVWLSCSDDGPGIPIGERERVLDPFVQLDGSSEGTGLGLTFVRAAAERHGAKLELQDNKPGLRVLVSFPANLTNL